MSTSTAAQTPASAEAFIREAERASNAYDLSGLAAPYADDAVFEVVTNGALERHVGRPAIAAAWGGYANVMRASGLQLRKELLAVDQRTVTNAWSGTLAGGGAACGVELWRFDGAGKVSEHRAWQFLGVRDAAGLGARVRLAIANPRLAFAIFGAQRATRAALRAAAPITNKETE